jgi:hypothetical protein
MSDDTLPLPPIQQTAAGMDEAGTPEEIVKIDFEKIYAVYLHNLQHKASLFKLLISFVIAPYLVAVAFLTAGAIEFQAMSDLSRLPTFLDFVVVVSGVGLLLPLLQYVEYDDNVMRTARSINTSAACTQTVWASVRSGGRTSPSTARFRASARSPRQAPSWCSCFSPYPWFTSPRAWPGCSTWLSSAPGFSPPEPWQSRRWQPFTC